MQERTRVKPLTWLPYHKRLIEDRARYIVCEKSRRVGWDYSHAYKKTSERIEQRCDRDLWYTSADESAAYEFIEYCRFFHERVVTMADVFEDDIEDREHPKGAVKAFCIRFPSGVRINALSSSPRRMRSKGGDVSISEFAFHDDPVKLYAAAQPVIMWGGNLEIGSTHNGEDSLFNRVCQDAKAYAAGKREIGGRPLNAWSFHYVDIHTAVSDGLVELINRSKGTSFTTAEFLHQLRAGCMTEDDWLQEYCCKPSTESSALLTYMLIAACEDAGCPMPGDPLRNVAGDEARYAGIDVGRHQDLTVVWIIGRVGDVLWTRQIAVLEKMPIPDQVDVIEGILRAAGVQRACVDATGLGIGISDGLRKRLGDYAVEPVVFTGPTKERLAVPVRAHFEDRTIRIPDHVSVREDLHKVRKSVTASGNVRFDAARDAAGHADRFWSLALAIEAAGSGSLPGCELVDPHAVAAARGMTPDIEHGKNDIVQRLLAGA